MEKTFSGRVLAKYKDGGTAKVLLSNHEVVYIDNRLRSETRGKVFDRYPGEQGAVELQIKVELQEKPQNYSRGHRFK